MLPRADRSSQFCRPGSQISWLTDMSKITCVLLDGQQAVRLIDRLLDRSQQPKLNNLQSTIVLETWSGRTYKSIADRLSYDLDYIKQIAAKLWKLLSPLLGENICKSNIQSVLARYQESIDSAEYDDPQDLPSLASWMISDRITTVAFLRSGVKHQPAQVFKIDLQAQGKIESLIWQNLHEPTTSKVFINELLAAISIKSLDQNPVNCLIVNCYFDR
jgi:hypothetical protein